VTTGHVVRYGLPHLEKPRSPRFELPRHVRIIPPAGAVPFNVPFFQLGRLTTRFAASPTTWFTINQVFPLPANNRHIRPASGGAAEI